MSKIEFLNLEKRFALKYIEDDNVLIAVAQEKGNLILSFTYLKLDGRVVECVGDMGNELKKNVPEIKEQVARVREYIEFARNNYNPINNIPNVIINKDRSKNKP